MPDIETVRCKHPGCGRWIAEVRHFGAMGFPVPLRWNGKPRRFNAVLHVYGPDARTPNTRLLQDLDAPPGEVCSELSAAWLEAGASSIWVDDDGIPVTFRGDEGEQGILVRVTRVVPDDLRPHCDAHATVNTMEFRCRKCGHWTRTILPQRSNTL